METDFNWWNENVDLRGFRVDGINPLSNSSANLNSFHSLFVRNLNNFSKRERYNLVKKKKEKYNNPLKEKKSRIMIILGGGKLSIKSCILVKIQTKAGSAIVRILLLVDTFKPD